MNKFYNKELDINVYESVLENKLKIFVIPKRGFSKTFAMLATNYGSIDSVFKLEDTWHKTPDGVAHFLEHKVFEQPDGTNALQLFSKTGASPNAFTSNTMTAYHFECTDEFETNLKILLDYVHTPYFTDENVKKEQGIISQEIGMIEDNPAWQVYIRLFKAMYKDHTINASIAGSVDSISEITKETLYLCHRAFYSPENMVLCVCGDVDPERVSDLAREFTPKESLKIADRDYGKEGNDTERDEISINMQVSMPMFMIGFKDNASQGDVLKKEIIAGIASICLCGSSSSLYRSLYDKGLINSSFSCEYNIFPGGGALVIGGESRDPREVRQIVYRGLVSILQNGISNEDFVRSKKASYGMMVRTLDAPDELCRGQIDGYFKGSNFCEFDKVYDQITRKDIENFLSVFADKARGSMSVVMPINK